MNEDYNFLKLKLSFLEALEKARGIIRGETYCISNFELYEKYGIELDDIENLIKKAENDGVIKIISENDLDNDFVEYPTKGYELSFDEKKFQKLLIDTRDKLSGKKAYGQSSDSDFFSVSTGKGLINNKDFRLQDGSNPFKIFCRLCLNKNKLFREDLVKIMYLPIDATNRTTNTMEINKEIKQIRATTGLNKNELINNGGNITLVRKLKIKKF